MITDDFNTGVSYLRLSVEEAGDGESGSIVNQRAMIAKFCKSSGIRLVREFVDDGWSGGNFQRPGFQAMLEYLRSGGANCVVTKDLSRLGRDMRESSYYAEEFFPEHGIRYIAIGDNFETGQDNVLAPFQFAMNEVYLRDGSRKIRSVLKSKREDGQYCACPPYGYRKDPRDIHRLTPDERTAPVVRRIFERAAAGDSTRKIATDLTEDGVIPPLKYRVLYRDNFSASGAARASDAWTYGTVKRILKNSVYLGHTVLGKSRKASVKSKKKLPVAREDWTVTRNTHAPLVTEEIFNEAQRNLGRGTRTYEGYEPVRRSIFSGIACCARCGHALCSAGTVYKGERERYWYLKCTHDRRDIENPCQGVRVRYSDLVELVRRDINRFISMDDARIKEMVEGAVERLNASESARQLNLRRRHAEERLGVIDRLITKLYTDNIAGFLDDERLAKMVSQLELEARDLKAQLKNLGERPSESDLAANYARFFELARKYTHLDTLDRETLAAFVERIEVGPKVLPEGTVRATHPSQPYSQSIRIFYRFIGEADVGNAGEELSGGALTQ